MASTISAGTTTTTALVYSADTSGVLQLQTNGTTTAVTIDTAQNAGFGVTPSAWKAGYNVIALGGSQGSILSSQTTNGLSLTTNLRFDAANGWTYINNGAANLHTLNGGAYSWLTAPSGTAGASSISFTQAMTLDNSGNLLVGLTSVPTNAVSAAGAASFASSIAAVGYNSRSGISGSYTNNRMNLYWSGSASYVYVDSTNLGQISYVSDYRLKENVETQTVNAIERVNALRPVTFNFKKVGMFEGSSTVQEGFIAHEVQQVIASAVNGEKDAINADGEIQPQNLNWMPIVSVLTAAIQELSAQVTTLQTQVTALQSKG